MGLFESFRNLANDLNEQIKTVAQGVTGFTFNQERDGKLIEQARVSQSVVTSVTQDKIISQDEAKSLKINAYNNGILAGDTIPGEKGRNQFYINKKNFKDLDLDVKAEKIATLSTTMSKLQNEALLTDNEKAKAKEYAELLETEIDGGKFEEIVKFAQAHLKTIVGKDKVGHQVLGDNATNENEKSGNGIPVDGTWGIRTETTMKSYNETPSEIKIEDFRKGTGGKINCEKNKSCVGDGGNIVPPNSLESNPAEENTVITQLPPGTISNQAISAYLLTDTATFKSHRLDIPNSNGNAKFIMEKSSDGKALTVSWFDNKEDGTFGVGDSVYSGQVIFRKNDTGNWVRDEKTYLENRQVKTQDGDITTTLKVTNKDKQKETAEQIINYLNGDYLKTPDNINLGKFLALKKLAESGELSIDKRSKTWSNDKYFITMPTSGKNYLIFESKENESTVKVEVINGKVEVGIYESENVLTKATKEEEAQVWQTLNSLIKP